MTSLQELSPVRRFFAVRVFPWSLVLFGSAFMYIGAENTYRAWRSSEWPTVTGAVVSSTVEERRESTGRQGTSVTYHAAILYDYVVDGVSYQGHRVSYGAYGTGETAHAESVVARYPEGAAVRIYYRPGSPQESVLEAGVHGVPWFFLGMGAVFGLIGVLLVVLLPWLASRGGS